MSTSLDLGTATPTARGLALADTLYGDYGADVLDGRGADDTLVGGSGADSENGGDGDDVFEQGALDRGDAFSGGAGARDRVSYARRHDEVVVDLDDVADDGVPSEADDVRSDVKQVAGGIADDTLTGSAATNVLLGGRGNDTLSGLAGADTLSGGSGDDTLLGGSGNDTLGSIDGVLGNDRLDGQADSDACSIDRFDAWASCEALAIHP
jgi:Ca2+-binding RTX toxin-like protein